MKEATGELTSTVIIVISVGVLMTFLAVGLYPIIRSNFRQQTACDKAKCGTNPDSDGMVDCSIDNEIIKCKYKG